MLLYLRTLMSVVYHTHFAIFFVVDKQIVYRYGFQPHVHFNIV